MAKYLKKSGTAKKIYKDVLFEMKWTFQRQTFNENGSIAPICNVKATIHNNSQHDLKFVNGKINVSDKSYYVSPSATIINGNSTHSSGGGGAYRKNTEQYVVKAAPLAAGREVSRCFVLSPEKSRMIGWEDIMGEFSDGTRFHKSEKDFSYKVTNFGRKALIGYAAFVTIPLGLLFAAQMYDEHGPGCFVLTAAHGDEKHPVVKEFRNFRDEVLNRYPVGRAFSNWYYEHGPKMAAFISDKPLLKAAVRGATIPFAAAIRLARRNQNKKHTL